MIKTPVKPVLGAADDVKIFDARDNLICTTWITFADQIISALNAQKPNCQPAPQTTTEFPEHTACPECGNANTKLVAKPNKGYHSKKAEGIILIYRECSCGFSYLDPHLESIAYLLIEQQLKEKPAPQTGDIQRLIQTAVYLLVENKQAATRIEELEKALKEIELNERCRERAGIGYDPQIHKITKAALKENQNGQE